MIRSILIAIYVISFPSLSNSQTAIDECIAYFTKSNSIIQFLNRVNVSQSTKDEFNLALSEIEKINPYWEDMIIKLFTKFEASESILSSSEAIKKHHKYQEEIIKYLFANGDKEKIKFRLVYLGYKVDNFLFGKDIVQYISSLKPNVKLMEDLNLTKLIFNEELKWTNQFASNIKILDEVLDSSFAKENFSFLVKKLKRTFPDYYNDIDFLLKESAYIISLMKNDSLDKINTSLANGLEDDFLKKLEQLRFFNDRHFVREFSDRSDLKYLYKFKYEIALDMQRFKNTEISHIYEGRIFFDSLVFHKDPSLYKKYLAQYSKLDDFNKKKLHQLMFYAENSYTKVKEIEDIDTLDIILTQSLKKKSSEIKESEDLEVIHSNFKNLLKTEISDETISSLNFYNLLNFMMASNSSESLDNIIGLSHVLKSMHDYGIVDQVFAYEMFRDGMLKTMKGSNGLDLSILDWSLSRVTGFIKSFKGFDQSDMDRVFPEIQKLGDDLFLYLLKSEAEDANEWMSFWKSMNVKID